jgi:hypothetical protein
MTSDVEMRRVGQEIMSLPDDADALEPEISAGL